MPGRLMTEMDVQQQQQQQAIPGLLKRDGSHLLQESDGPEQKRIATGDAVSTTKLNGAHSAAATNGVHTEPATLKGEAQDQNPPEIEQFRDTLVPFGRILERMAQQTYFDLTELVEAMADMHVQPQPHAINGVGGPAAPDKSPVSIDKKLRMLNFAQLHKDRFIKALVLSDWAKNMDDMAKLIDVSMCLRKQDWATTAAADSIYRLKENMVGAKMPNPNIEGALELLSSGQAPWMPDMGYIPPKPLTAPELLETLSDMNFALTVRLNLHEQLPKQLSHFTIANGRVTFIVKDEFQVDLALADEEPDSPFYFIDLRLTFTPAVTINQDRLRNQLEAQINSVLATSGLVGCYDLLHNFVLTHKLNMLRCQAQELTRGKWIDNIEVHNVHRTVIIHYWTKLSQGKNWIELGIASGNGDQASGENLPTVKQSNLSCRWFRRGKEVVQHDLRFDFADLSVERMLEHVVATHSSGRLTVLHGALEEMSKGTTAFAQTLATSSSSSEDCSLRLLLDPLSTPLTVSVDAVRGSLIASPGTDYSADLDLELNDEHKDPSVTLRRALCREALRHVTDQGQSVGLARVAVDAPQGQASPFPAQVVTHRSFRLPTSGTEDAATSPPPAFVLTATASLLNGLAWYISETTTSREGALVIKSASSLEAVASGIDRAAILAVATTAAQKVASLALSRELRDKQITSAPAVVAGQEPGDGGALLLRTSDLLPKEAASTESIFADAASLALSSAKGPKYVFRASLKKSSHAPTVDRLRNGLAVEPDTTLSSSGLLSIAVQPTSNQSVVALLQSRLHSIVQLYAMISLVHARRLTLTSATLSSISFTYGDVLSCTLDSSTSPATLLFSPATNPHSRIQRQLTDLFARSPPSTRSFRSLLSLLSGTLPLLSALPAPSASVQLVAHSPTMYKLVYRAPYPCLALRLAAQQRSGRVLWMAKIVAIKAMSAKLKTELGELFNRGRGKGWMGCKVFMVATADGVNGLLEVFGGVMEGNKEEREVVEID